MSGEGEPPSTCSGPPADEEIGAGEGPKKINPNLGSGRDAEGRDSNQLGDGPETVEAKVEKILRQTEALKSSGAAPEGNSGGVDLTMEECALLRAHPGVVRKVQHAISQEKVAAVDPVPLRLKLLDGQVRVCITLTEMSPLGQQEPTPAQAQGRSVSSTTVERTQHPYQAEIRRDMRKLRGTAISHTYNKDALLRRLMPEVLQALRKCDEHRPFIENASALAISGGEASIALPAASFQSWQLAAVGAADSAEAVGGTAWGTLRPSLQFSISLPELSIVATLTQMKGDSLGVAKRSRAPGRWDTMGGAAQVHLQAIEFAAPEGLGVVAVLSLLLSVFKPGGGASAPAIKGLRPGELRPVMVSGLPLVTAPALRVWHAVLETTGGSFRLPLLVRPRGLPDVVVGMAGEQRSGGRSPMVYVPNPSTGESWPSRKGTVNRGGQTVPRPAATAHVGRILARGEKDAEGFVHVGGRQKAGAPALTLRTPVASAPSSPTAPSPQLREEGNPWSSTDPTCDGWSCERWDATPAEAQKAAEQQCQRDREAQETAREARAAQEKADREGREAHQRSLAQAKQDRQRKKQQEVEAKAADEAAAFATGGVVEQAAVAAAQERKSSAPPKGVAAKTSVVVVGAKGESKALPKSGRGKVVALVAKKVTSGVVAVAAAPPPKAPLERTRLQTKQRLDPSDPSPPSAPSEPVDSQQGGGSLAPVGGGDTSRDTASVGVAASGGAPPSP
jgi:hypothetical protein